MFAVQAPDIVFINDMTFINGQFVIFNVSEEAHGQLRVSNIFGLGTHRCSFGFMTGTSEFG